MPFTTPRTWVAFEIPTAAMYNTHIRDNINDLHARTNASAARVSTSQTTASATFVDLPTVGPSVTLVTGTEAIVSIGVEGLNSGGAGAQASFAVTGATSRIAVASEAVGLSSTVNQSASRLVLVAGLTAGSNTFTMKYRSGFGGTSTFLNRELVVWPSDKLS